MNMTESKAMDLAEKKFLENERVLNIIKKYSDRVAFASQRTREDITIYRTGLYIGDPIDETKHYDSTGGRKLDYIAYCDVSFETGKCSNIVFLDSFEDFE